MVKAQVNQYDFDFKQCEGKICADCDKQQQEICEDIVRHNLNLKTKVRQTE